MNVVCQLDDWAATRAMNLPSGEMEALYMSNPVNLLPTASRSSTIVSIDPGTGSGAANAGLDRLVDLAALDTELADRVLTAFGTRRGE